MSRTSGIVLIALGIALGYVFFQLPFAGFFRGDVALWRPERPFELISFMYWSVPIGALLLVLIGLAPLLGVETHSRIGFSVMLAGGIPVLTSVLHLLNISASSPRNSNDVIGLLGSGFWGTIAVGVLIALVGGGIMLQKPQSTEVEVATQ